MVAYTPAEEDCSLHECQERPAYSCPKARTILPVKHDINGQRNKGIEVAIKNNSSPDGQIYATVCQILLESPANGKNNQMNAHCPPESCIEYIQSNIE